MKKTTVVFSLMALLLAVLPVLAQAPAPAPADAENPASAALRQFYNGAKRNILRGAEKMPEENYSFRATPEVRTFSELLAHIAEGNYLFCSSLKGEPVPVARGELEKSKTTKAEILPVLQASFDACDAVFTSLTDAQLGDKIQFFNRERTKAVPATLAVAHSWEHYGNMVTYMRLKGIVPPSSEPPPPPPPAAQEKPAEPPKP
ncbi:MAG: DinB family protein, partial [Terriglobales bacterium]